MKKHIIFISVAAMCMMSVSCSVISNLASQLQGIANLANCEYTLTNINNVSIAGVNLKKIAGGQVSASDVVMLSTALLQKKLPLNMDVNINVKNPTEHNANLTSMDWIMDIEQTQIASGKVDKRYTIGAKKSAVVPLSVGTDVYNLFSKQGIESVKKFAGSFSNDGTSSKVALKIRPYVTVANMTMPTSYITLKKNVGATPKSR